MSLYSYFEFKCGLWDVYLTSSIYLLQTESTMNFNGYLRRFILKGGKLQIFGYIGTTKVRTIICRLSQVSFYQPKAQMNEWRYCLQNLEGLRVVQSVILLGIMTMIKGHSQFKKNFQRGSQKLTLISFSSFLLISFSQQNSFMHIVL